MCATEASAPLRDLPASRQFGPRFRSVATWSATVAFLLMHVACLAAIFTGISTLAVSLCGACYLVQMIGITARYHRYFAHRSFKTSWRFQFVLAWVGCTAGQRGPLWWVAQHRHHHRTSDTSEDRHSPIAHSVWWSHVVNSRYQHATQACSR